MGRMTVVAQRRILRVQHPSAGPTRSLALGALIGVGWVVLAGLTTALALAVAAWWAADSGSFGAAVRSVRAVESMHKFDRGKNMTLVFGLYAPCAQSRPPL